MRSQVGDGTAVCAVVKADAYGHGAEACARVFADAGVRWLAVTSPEEGARLRAAGIDRARILVLAGFSAADADTLIELQLTPAIWDLEHVVWLAAAMERHPQVERFPVHLKLESGMGRLGVTPAQESAMTAALRRAPRLQVEALFSHLATAETSDDGGSREQHARFQAARARLAPEASGHLLNSEGAFRYPQWGEMLVRTGLALYGYSAQAEPTARLEPALRWKTRVLAVKDLPAGHGIGYGWQFRAPGPIRVATIAVGYADGYRRQLWPGAYVRFDAGPAPVVGNISMDPTTVDVTRLPAPRVGDEVLLLGPTPGPTAADLAGWARTIPYEVLCGLSARVERRYRD